MRAATSELGEDLKKNRLKECWGFDCINSEGQIFGTWAAGLPGVSFYFYVVLGSIDYGNFSSHLIFAYGTPQKPKKPPMAKVFLAPAVNDPDLINVPDDQVIESFDAIQKKQQAALSASEAAPGTRSAARFKEWRLGDRSQKAPLEATLRGGPGSSETAHRTSVY